MRLSHLNEEEVLCDHGVTTAISFWRSGGVTFRFVTFPFSTCPWTVVLNGALSLKSAVQSLGQAGRVGWSRVCPIAVGSLRWIAPPSRQHLQAVSPGCGAGRELPASIT